MSVVTKHLNVEDAKLRPEANFSSPQALIEDDRLSAKEKLEVLETWADQIDRRLASGSEGMPTHGTEPRDAELLREIGLATEQLQGTDPNR
ncbi:MAG: hypothetical protein KJ622_00300 [Alphaproteobacteria bacterium]|nr:hypothetical protein [Alphaproteobacteria bacterium]